MNVAPAPMNMLHMLARMTSGCVRVSQYAERRGHFGSGGPLWRDRLAQHRGIGVAAMLTSTVSPGTTSICTTAGVLSWVLMRFPAGSFSIEARKILSG